VDPFSRFVARRISPDGFPMPQQAQAQAPVPPMNYTVAIPPAFQQAQRIVAAQQAGMAGNEQNYADLSAGQQMQVQQDTRARLQKEAQDKAMRDAAVAAAYADHAQQQQQAQMATGFGAPLSGGFSSDFMPPPDNPVTYTPNKIGGVGDNSGWGSTSIGGAIGSVINTAKDTALSAIPYIDKPRQITTSQMGELVYQAANGDGTLPPILAAAGPAGQQLWSAMTEQARKDKDKINALYTQGDYIGGVNTNTPFGYGGNQGGTRPN